MEGAGIILVWAAKEKPRHNESKPFAQGPELVDTWIADWGEHPSKEEGYKQEGDLSEPEGGNG